MYTSSPGGCGWVNTAIHVCLRRPIIGLAAAGIAAGGAWYASQEADNRCVQQPTVQTDLLNGSGNTAHGEDNACEKNPVLK